MSFVGGLIVIAIAIIIFLLFRAVVLWYFRIDQIVALLTDINGWLAFIQADNKKLEQRADEGDRIAEKH